MKLHVCAKAELAPNVVNPLYNHSYYDGSYDTVNNFYALKGIERLAVKLTKFIP